MIEKGKISSFQMAVMMYPTIIATAILVIPAISAEAAGRDLWLSPFWALGTGFVTIAIAIKLHSYFPKETVIEYCPKIIGKVPGKIIGLLFLLFYLHINGVIIREYTDFVIGIFLMETPMIVVIASMVFVSALAVRAGLEVLARTAEMFVPIVLFIIFVIIVLLLSEIDFDNIFPIFEEGITPSFLGALMPSSWYSEFFLISFLLPYVANPNKALRWSVMSLLLISFSLMVTNLVVMLLFGLITEDLSYPLMSAARYISIADFFENVEAVVMALWVAGAYVKIAVFYYALVIGTAQWLDLSNYRPVVFPIGMLLVIFGVWVTPTFTEMRELLGATSPVYLPFVQTLIPLFLLVVVIVKKRMRNRSQENEQVHS
ncbi:GerAB/ArcD/ProY family transporter [Desertibacillus haloalkaliphilus]|uniref:GerAB/ArcD/ProY family transporter n=1 Tax=Desertibacillus haloalkaliphilus TaxID=1328930 RepID=UPI001C262621|nr:endospore germination permease [Desertibacillus haloalkaliphilus]MBU8906637.1 spore germination protein [Desertibacillus haloalkaliphilus]